LRTAVIAMEACASAHYWGRRFLAAGHQIRLINPRFVKPFVKIAWVLLTRIEDYVAA